MGASLEIRTHLPGRCSAVELNYLPSNEATAHSDVVLEMEVKEKVELERKVPTPHLQIFIGAIDAITFVPGASPHVTYSVILFSPSHSRTQSPICALSSSTLSHSSVCLCTYQPNYCGTGEMAADERQSISYKRE